MLTTAVVFACLIAVVSGSCRYVQVREDCGYPGISESECMENGCCYDDSIWGITWCYYESAASSPCASWSCQNGGLCTTGNNKVTCMCPKVYSGEHCENYDASKGDPTDPCKPTPCENGGTCSAGADNKAVCKCPAGPYDPLYCEATVKCQADSCENGGMCRVVEGAVTCKCITGFTGPTCGQSIPCDPLLCQNGGSCISVASSCQCLPGYLNTRCQDVVMQKHDGADFLGRTWAEMKAGIGDPEGSSFWLGNDKIHELTKDGQYKLRIDMHAKYDWKWYYAEYETFIVNDENYYYQLTVGGYSGTAGNAFYDLSQPGKTLNGATFTTIDRDNDNMELNCAIDGGAFWHKICTHAQLNSKGSRFKYVNLISSDPFDSEANALLSSQMTLVYKNQY